MKGLLLTALAILFFSCSSTKVHRMTPPKQSLALSRDLEKNIERGKIERALRELSSKPLQVYAVSKKGQSALHIAAMKNRIEIVEVLLNAGAKVNLQDKEGNTPLHYACYANKVESVSLLMKFGADPKIQNSKEETAMHKAAFICGEEIFDMLYLMSNLEGVNHLGRKPLHVAARYQNLEFCRLLLGAKVQETPLDFEGNDPLMSCLKGLNSNEELERLFISKLQNTEFANKKGEHYLHAAATTDKASAIISLLDAGAIVDCKDNACVTPLIRALRNRKKNAARVLVDNGADISVKDNDGRTLLHLMAFWMTEKTELKEFIEVIDINAVDTKGRSALHDVVYWGHKNNAQELIKAGANVNIASIENGETPIFGAVRKRRLEMVDLLIKSKAELKIKNVYGETALKLAVSGDESDLDIIKLLLQSGAEVNALNIYNESIAHEIVRSGDVDLMKLFLKYKPDLSLKDRLDKTPLDWAIERKLTKMINILKNHQVKN